MRDKSLGQEESMEGEPIDGSVDDQWRAAVLKLLGWPDASSPPKRRRTNGEVEEIQK